MEALKTVVCVKINLQIRSTNNQVVSFYESIGFVSEDRISMGKLIDPQQLYDSSHTEVTLPSDENARRGVSH